MRLSIFLLVLLSQQLAYSADNFTGSWIHEESCSAVEKRFRQESGADVKCSNKIHGPSMLEDANGKAIQGVPPDFFRIDLVSQGDLLCGFVTSTRMNRNRVDSSIVVGWVAGSRAELVFSSSFTEWAETGSATLQFKGANADWSVTKKIPASYAWSEAVVSRRVLSQKTSVVDSCKDKWQKIRRRDFSGISYKFL